jgi:hypothetical protein
VAGNLAEQPRDIRDKRVLGPNLEATLKLSLDRFDDERRPVAQEVGPKAADEIDVLVTVDIP